MLTLLSDFGLSDIYVGVMKGLVAKISPQLTVVDLTHQVPPQNIWAARFCLMNAVPYFPAGTVHVAVVDPGVGSRRRAIAVEFARGFLVGPDNGIFSGVLSEYSGITAVELTNSNYWRTIEPSATFHGRDIFAPVAAHLANGVPLQQLGNFIDPSTLVQLDIPPCIPTNTGVSGCIQYIDHFGNLITNIPGAYVADKTWWVETAELVISGYKTYYDSPVGKSVALVGSHGWVEIAVNGGNAQSQLQLSWGERVQVILESTTLS